MIIFEGPDGSGKSTLASYVSHELGIPLHHFGKPPKDIDEIKERIEFMFKNYDLVMFDRIPLISEQVYSITRPINLISQLEESTAYYKRLRDLNPIIIYCRPPMEVILEIPLIKKPHDNKSHLKAVSNTLTEIVDRYDQVMESEYFRGHWNFDFTTQEHDVILDKIEGELIKRNHYKLYY